MDVGAERELRARDRTQGRLRDVLELHPALHPCAVLRLCLRVRRLPGEFALCGLREIRRRLRRALSGDVSCRRHQAPHRTARPLRPRCPRSEVLGWRVERNRQSHQRTRSLGRGGLIMVAPTDREKNRFSARAKRYASVGSKVGGVAARMAGARLLGKPQDRAANAIGLAAALGGLKGPIMKVAQLLATIPDGPPAAVANELMKLQSQAPPMGWAFVKRRMSAELGPDWQAKFAEFEHHPAAAASLGQVHRGRARDGSELACKLQYPDMQSAVEADLNQLQLLFSIRKRIHRG